MLTLGINTATSFLGIGLAEDEKILVDINLAVEQSHNKHLLPMIRQALQMKNYTLKDVDNIGTVIGPGSFTGLRISLATVKAFALTNKFSFIPISTLDTFVPTIQRKGYYMPMLNARRKRVYTTIFKGGEELPVKAKEIDDQAVKLSDILNFVQETIPGRSHITFLGPAVVDYQNQLKKTFSSSNYDFSLITTMTSTGQGGEIARLAYYYCDEGLGGDIKNITPKYLKQPQAEITWQAKQRGEQS
ncbi:MAG: tRNA (adenosine(37)-N6)-threonylcarbamoyltransferase complex dimerization subunit type 1 TsaB [Bacillota bacterium]